MSYIGNEPIVSATRTITEVTATAGQTVFNANGGYTVGYIDVFLNGAQLQTVDFTATNGSSITLTEAAQAGDVIRLVAWGTFQSANLNGAGLIDGTVTDAKIASVNYSKLTGTVPTWNQNTTGSANYATNAGSADQSFEWKGSGNTSNWNTHFQDTLPASCTQNDINSGTNCPTGGGWWFAQSFRHSNSSSFWGTQYAHGWEDRAYQRYVRNVGNGSFGGWQLDVGCRAWVNFNGVGTVAIRASGNVSSISDNGVGDFTVNFLHGMIDTNYSSVGFASWVDTGAAHALVSARSNTIKSTTQFQFNVVNSTAVSFVDTAQISIAIFR